MGNRAVLALDNKEDSVGIYLHWNGGIESVLAFIDASKNIGARDPSSDGDYFLGSLINVIQCFGLNTGINTIKNLDCDNGDNGLYIIGEGFSIKERVYSSDKRLDIVRDSSHNEFVKKLVKNVLSKRDN